MTDLKECYSWKTFGSEADDVKIKEGANIEVKFALDEKQVALKGRVVRHGSEQRSYAIEFYDSEPRSRQVVKRFVQNSIEKLKEKKK